METTILNSGSIYMALFRDARFLFTLGEVGCSFSVWDSGFCQCWAGLDSHLAEEALLIPSVLLCRRIL